MAYVAKAVHFAGATSLRIASVACTDNGKLSYSYWYKGMTESPWETGTPVVWALDPTGNYNGWAGVGSSGIALGNFSKKQELDFDSPGNTSIWHHVLFSTDVSGGSPVHALYIDGAPVPLTGSHDDSPFTFPFNGLPLWIGDDNGHFPLIGNVAEVWIAPGVSLLSGSTIPDATIAKFRTIPGIAGKPVDPAGFPAGGTVFFSGDAITFQTNRLGGGVATLHGPLTNAANSPSTQVLVRQRKYQVLLSGTTWTPRTDVETIIAVHALGAGQAGQYGDAALGGDGATYAKLSIIAAGTFQIGHTYDIHIPAQSVGSHTVGDDAWLKNGSGTVVLRAPGGASASSAIGSVIRAGGTALTPTGGGTYGAQRGGGGGAGSGGPDGVGADSGDIRPGNYEGIDEFLLYAQDAFDHFDHTDGWLMTAIQTHEPGAGGGAGNGGQPGGGAAALSAALQHRVSTIAAFANAPPATYNQLGYVGSQAATNGTAVLPGDGGDGPAIGDDGGRHWALEGLGSDGFGAGGGAGGPTQGGVSLDGAIGGESALWIDSETGDTAGPGGGGGGVGFFTQESFPGNYLQKGLAGFGGFGAGGGGGGPSDEISSLGQNGYGGPGWLVIEYDTPATFSSSSGSDAPVTVTRTPPVPKVRQLRPFEQIPYAEFHPMTSTTVLPIRFRVMAQTDLRVTVDGVELAQADFTFAGNLVRFPGWDDAAAIVSDANFRVKNNPYPGYHGGTVTLDSAIIDQTVRIWSDPHPARTTDLVAGEMKMAQTNAALETLWVYDRAQHLRQRRLPGLVGTTPAAANSGALLMDDGAALALPIASAGLRFRFHVVSSMQIAAHAGDSIYDGTASAKTQIASSQPGAMLELVSPDVGRWFVASKRGTWVTA